MYSSLKILILLTFFDFFIVDKKPFVYKHPIMGVVNPDNNLLLSSKEKSQGVFATRDYVKAQVETVKRRVEKVRSYLVIHFIGLLVAFFVAILAFVWYLHNDTKQALREAKQERAEASKERAEAKQERAEAKQERAKASRERQELKQQISELKALIESLHGVNKGEPTRSK